MRPTKTGVMLKLVAQSGKRDELVAHLMATVEGFRAETGLELWVINLSPTEPDAVWIYEVYADQAAKEAHEAPACYAAARCDRRAAGRSADRDSPDSLDSPVGQRLGARHRGGSMKLGYAIFWVEDAERTAQFFEAAFGLKRRMEIQTALSPFIEMETGETALAFAEFSEADAIFEQGYRRHDLGELPVASVISFVTNDVQSLYDRVLAHGGSSFSAPKAESWGQTIARVRDPNGITISLTTPLPAPK